MSITSYIVRPLVLCTLVVPNFSGVHGENQEVYPSARSHFRDYWGSFALHWGLRLFLDSAAELCSNGSMPEEGLNEETVLSAAERIGAYGQVPIITAEELAWPE